jgi:hypothetical protein
MTQPVSEQSGSPVVSLPIREQVKRVAAARAGLAEFQEDLVENQRAFDAANAQLLQDLGHARATVAAEEQALRAFAVTEYRATGETHPAPGVSIKLVKTVDYDVDEAFAWAKTQGMALKLDEAALRKIAIATPIACAVVDEVPTAVIAQDLAKVLALTGEAA